MNDETKRSIALFRFGVLGPLVNARLEHGERKKCFEQAAAHRYVTPDRREVRVSARTIEGWYYSFKAGGFDALLPAARVDDGKSRSIPVDVQALIIKAKCEKPRRSIRRIIRMLERARVVKNGVLSKASVHRLLQRSGISARPVRGPSNERRSFLVERVGDLWVADALRGPYVIAADGRVRRSMLISQIDGASRYILHSRMIVADGERAVDHEYGLKQAFLKFGLPRKYYVDRGPPYVAGSLTSICAELGVPVLHTESGDAEAKGVIERWHETWRAEVEDELPDEPIPIDELVGLHWAWLGAEYHAREHTTTKRIPGEHFREELLEHRAIPSGKNLDEVFLHRIKRHVRKDGTVRWNGSYLEVRAELVGENVELRFDPVDDAVRPRVFVDGKFFCDTVPLDLKANAHRVRHRPSGAAAPLVPKSGLNPLQLIAEEHYRRTGNAANPQICDDEDEE